MTATQSIKLYELFRRYFQNENDAKTFIEEVENIVDKKVDTEKQNYSTKSEVELLRKDMQALRIELKSDIENSSLRVENNLKSEINKLIVWIVATIFATSALILAVAKLLF